MYLAGAGVKLAAEAVGDPTSIPIVFAHGGGQTKSAWKGSLVAMAARGFYAIALDLRGHGESEWSPDGDYRLERFADDLRAVASQLAQPAFFVGASLGGLASLVAVASPPEAPARGLVLVDVAPRVEPEGGKHIVAFMRSAPNGFATLEQAGAAVAAYVPHRPRPNNLEGLRRNLRLHPDGRLHWHWDPRLLAEGPFASNVAERQTELDAAVRRLQIPALMVRGAMSKVLSQEGVDDFLRNAPHAEFVQISGADHMIAGDQNDAFGDAIAAFIERYTART